MASDSGYTFDFSAFSQATATSGGMAFMQGGAPASASSAAPASGAAPAGGAASSGDSAAAGASGGGDAGSQIAQSPFGALLNLPGVTAENLFSNVNPADYSSSGGNPFAQLAAAGNGAYGGNPFANIGTLVTNDYNAATQGSGAMGASSNPLSGSGGAGF